MNNDSIGWEIYKAIKALFDAHKDDIKKVNLREVKQFLYNYLKTENITKPSLLHSLILSQALKLYETYKIKGKVNTAIDIVAFAKMWNLDYLREGAAHNDSDFIPFEPTQSNPNGKKINFISLVQKITRAILEESVDKKDRQSIECFLPYLNKVIEFKKEDIVWVLFTRTNAYIFLQEYEKAKKDMIVVIKRKSKDTWAWDTLATIFSFVDKDMEFACYCKTLSLVLSQKQEDFVWQIRDKFANLLIKRQNLSAAKYELEQIFKCRNKNGWTISQDLIIKLKSLENIQSTKDNKSLYAEFSPLAEKCVFGETRQNKNTSQKDFSGVAKVNEKGFAFVDNIFINPILVKKYQITNGAKISGKAVPSTKKKDSWEAITIQVSI